MGQGDPLALTVLAHSKQRQRCRQGRTRVSRRLVMQIMHSLLLNCSFSSASSCSIPYTSCNSNTFPLNYIIYYIYIYIYTSNFCLITRTHSAFPSPILNTQYVIIPIALFANSAVLGYTVSYM